MAPRAASGASTAAGGIGHGSVCGGVEDASRDGDDSADYLGGHCDGNGGASCERNGAHRSSLSAEEESSSLFAGGESSVPEVGPRVPVGCAQLLPRKDVLTQPPPGKSEDVGGGTTSTTQVTTIK